VARREVDATTGNMTLQCAGCNDRNLYPRATPCDQDFLRKLARDTEPEKLEEWYNSHVAAIYKDLDAFDGEGLFIADGTYLFVPDNPRYEGSQKLFCDEHNHPVSKIQQQEMTKEQRARCRWRRFYKAVLLLHCDSLGERFLIVGLRVLKENEAEATALWPMLDTFLVTVGAGVMKILLLDRGFINGAQMGRLKRDHNIDTVIPIRSDMNWQDDVKGLMKLPTPWEEYEAKHRDPLPDVTKPSHGRPIHPTAAKREKTRQKTLARKNAEQEQACGQLKSWWNVCTQGGGGSGFQETRSWRFVMASSTRTFLSAEKEAEAQALAHRIRELADEDLLQMARLLVSKPDRELFGDTEYQLRDMVLKFGAKALEEHLRKKKTATSGAA